MLSLSQLHQKKVSSIDEVEQFRLQQYTILKRVRYCAIVPILLIIIGGGLFIFSNSSFCAIIFFCLAIIASLLIVVLKMLPIYGQFNDQFRQKALHSFLEGLYSNVYYAPDNYIPSRLFAKSNFCLVEGSYTGNDYIEVETQKENKFKFSTISIQNSDSIQDSICTFFKGGFYVLDVSVQSTSPVYILPNNTKPQIEQLATLKQQALTTFLTPSDKQKYNLDFSKEFTIYYQDVKTVRLFLQEPVLKALYEWYKQCGCKAYMSWIGQQLFIALPNISFPQPNIYYSLTANDSLHQFYNQLIYGLSLMEYFGAEPTKINQSK